MSKYKLVYVEADRPDEIVEASTYTLRGSWILFMRSVDNHQETPLRTQLFRSVKKDEVERIDHIK